MKKHSWHLRLWTGILLLALLALLATACSDSGDKEASPPPASSAASTAQTGSSPAASSAAPVETARILRDMAGREVKLPPAIKKAVTIGSVPVINSFIFAVGGGDTIGNGLPDFARKPRWKYQTVFAPAIADKPVMQAASGNEPLTEEILKAAPDVVFTMDKAAISTLEGKGITSFYLENKKPEDVKEIVRLLGEIYNKPDTAEQYAQYFDGVIQRVETAVSGIPADKRPKVLNLNVDSMNQPHLIAEWWITAAGGVSVTNDGRTQETLGLSMEQILHWNPDVLIVASAEQRENVLKDEKFAQISAVASKRIFVAPTGAHTWANRTVEQPLTVLWAYQHFYPDLFGETELLEEVQGFYKQFFETALSDEQVKEILDAKL